MFKFLLHTIYNLFSSILMLSSKVGLRYYYYYYYYYYYCFKLVDPGISSIWAEIIRNSAAWPWGPPKFL
jgi:hypothetical protein